MRHLTAWATAVLLVCASAPAEPDRSAGARVAAFKKERDRLLYGEDRDIFPASELRVAHAEWLSGLPEQAERLDDTVLRDLFSVSLMHAYDVETQDAVHRVRMIYDEFARRHPEGWHGTERRAADMHDLYLAVRDWNGAAAIRARYPAIPAPPVAKRLARRADTRYAYHHSPDGLTEVPALRDDHTGMVVTVHPSCRYSRRALEAIRSDEALKPLLEGSVLLVDPYAGLADPKIAAWNDREPSLQMLQAVHKHEWPEVSYWGTPTFYFYHQGRVVHRVTGWPRDESDARLQNVREGFSRIGLLPGERLPREAQPSSKR